MRHKEENKNKVVRGENNLFVSSTIVSPIAPFIGISLNDQSLELRGHVKHPSYRLFDLIPLMKGGPNHTIFFYFPNY